MRNRSSSREQDAAKLVARVREGDDRALGLLMQWYAEELTTFALIIVHRIDLAQDAVQNVFIALWNRRTTLDLTGRVDSYLYRAVRNQAITLLRHEKTTQKVSDELQQAYRVGELVAWNEGEASLEADEFDTAVRRALASLQPQAREIFLMRRLQGLNYEEIAAALEISVLTARSQMSRALRKVAETLGHR